MCTAEERIIADIDLWLKDPNAPMTENRELERTDAILEFFGFPDFMRQDGAKRIKAKYAASRQANA